MDKERIKSDLNIGIAIDNLGQTLAAQPTVDLNRCKLKRLPPYITVEAIDNLGQHVNKE